MKTILVPTDYSETAVNATNYAIEMAKQIKAQVLLLHVFDVPITVTDVPVVIDSFDEFEKSKRKQLKNHEKELIAKHGEEVHIKSILTPGFLSDEIQDVVKEHKIDMVVMGITGAGKIPEILIGSNATRVIKNVECPVITVHSDVKYHPIKKIAFACDYADVEESFGITKLIEFIQLFDAKLLLLNILGHGEDHSLKKELSGALLEHLFDEVNHSVSFRKNDDVVEGINQFVDQHHIDLVVMLPKKHTLFSRLFQESNTKKMAFHTHVPLLTIHN